MISQLTQILANLFGNQSFPLLKCEDKQHYFITYDSKPNIFGFWTVGHTFEEI